MTHPNHLRTRAVQDAIYAVVFALGTLAMYTAPVWGLAYLVPASACLYSLVDLGRVVARTITR